MHRAVVSLPDGLDSQVRWLVGELCAAAGSRNRRRARPRYRSTRPGISRAPRPLLARKEELGGAVDEHGRFPAAASSLAAGRSPARRPRARVARAAAAAGLTPAPDYPGRRALRRGADARHRHALALERARPAAARAPGSRPRSRGGDAAAARVEAAGLARVPLHLLLRQRPQLVARPLRRARARGAASPRPASCSRPTATRTTAPRPRPTPRAAGASWASSTRLGLEVGLHASYTCLADEGLLAQERAELARLLGGPVAGNRHHYLRLPWHAGIRALDRLGFSYDTTLGYAERPGPRAGLSFPFRPWDIAAGAPLRHPRAPAPADGRDARRAALPRALARGGLGRGRARARPPARRAAAARASSGTTTASTASTAVAGAGSTSDSSTASRHAAATPPRRAR